jgi:hypothetical protein
MGSLLRKLSPFIFHYLLIIMAVLHIDVVVKVLKVVWGASSLLLENRRESRCQ